MNASFFRNETVESGSFRFEDESVTKPPPGDDNDDLESDFDPTAEEDREEQEQDQQLEEEEASDSFNEQKTTIPSSQIYLDRIKRRSLLISEIRKAYLRDVVLLKHILNEYFTQENRENILQQWEKSIPSLDLRQHFMIYSPNESSLDLLPCETCGGSVEIVHHDSSEIQELSKALSHLDKNKNELRIIIAKKNLQIENLDLKIENEERKHKEEVRKREREERVRDRVRDRERDRERQRQRVRDRVRDRERDRERQRETETESERERERERERVSERVSERVRDEKALSPILFFPYF
jgi:hypothetical protein